MTSINDSGLRLRSITLKPAAAGNMLINDGLANVVTSIGTSRDQNSWSHYFARELSQEQIEASYRSSWLSAKIHNIIPTDAVRAGWRHKADDTDITLIEATERRLQVNIKLRKALLLARLYGGSVMFMGIGNEDPRTPLRLESVGKDSLRYLHIMSRHQVTVQNLILDPGSEFYMQPEEYLINTGGGTLFPVHASRIIKFNRDDISDEIGWANQGWSDPLLTSVWSALTNADTAQGNFSAVLNKLKVDTITIPGLASVFATQESEDAFKRRVLAATMFESMLNTKLIGGAARSDEVGEKWETYNQPLSGIPEVMMAFVQMVGGASDIPTTRLVGKSADGQNATGDGDERDYQIAVKSLQELNLRPRHEKLNEVIYRSSLGARPSSIWTEYSPLFVESDKEKAENAYKRAQATTIYNDSGLVPVEVLQEATKGQLIESGEYPGIEQAYIDYEAGLLEPIIEPEEDAPDDPLIPVDPTTGNPTQNRESRLFAANDMVAVLLGQGHSAPEAVRLSDARPRPLYVQRKVLNVDEIKAWAREQGLPELNGDLHVTITYSRDPVDWIKMGSTWSDAGNDAGGRLTINAGGPRVVEPLGDQAAALMFASSDLSWRHTEMVREGASWDYPDYTPHISLVKSGAVPERIEPYRGKIELGMEIFEELRL